MQIGIPKETKPLEGRIALTPHGIKEMVDAGHSVIIERNAGIQSGYSDTDYINHGATIAEDAAALFQSAQLIVKVKEPIANELNHLKPHHLLFCFLHLAALPELTQKLQNIGLTALAFETIAEHGQLPLLAPMSEIAGHVAIQAGAHYLHSSQGGKGLLLGGVIGTEHGHVVVIGAGKAGLSATQSAAATGAKVTVFDLNPNALRNAAQLGANVTCRYALKEDIVETIKTADLVIGAVLIPGAQAPKIISREMIKSMKPGSVFVDISVDQGGCSDTTHPTDYTNPTYVEEDVIHMAVTNLPGAVARTATQALSAPLTHYVLRLAQPNWQQDTVLKNAINVENGQVIHPALLNK